METTSYDHLPQDHNINKILAVSSSVSVDTLSCLRVWYIAPRGSYHVDFLLRESSCQTFSGNVFGHSAILIGFLEILILAYYNPHMIA